MQKGIIGKKLGMTQLFDENGKVVPVTVIEAGPCTVVQKKTVESDGYEAVQLGFGEVSAKKVNKAAKGHFDKADVAPKRTLREFRLDDISGMNVGDILKADVFVAGDKVDVIGTSKGKGYQGVIKRFGQHRLRESHGTGPVARHAGSNGSTSTPSRRGDPEHGVGKLNGGNFLAAHINDIKFSHCVFLLYALTLSLTQTTEPFGPGMAPLMAIRLFSASTLTMLRF